MRYFEGISTIEELKKAYRKLALQFHPDRGGSTEVMSEINNQYEQAFEELKKGDKKAHASENAFDGFRDIMDELIILENLVIEICGSWVWLDGASAYPYRAKLNELGFKWASKKRKWYWHSGEWKKFGKKTYSMDEIRMKYGSETVRTKGNNAFKLDKKDE